MAGLTRRGGKPVEPVTKMKPEGQSDMVTARFAAKLFTVGTAGASLRPAAPPMNNFG